MANSSINLTPGSGVVIDSHQISSGDQQQIVRTAKADTINGTGTPWTAVTTSATPIPANEGRVALLVYNASTVRVYIAFGTVTVNSSGSNAGWYLDAGDRWEVPDGLCQMAVSIIAATAGSGTVNFTPGDET